MGQQKHSPHEAEIKADEELLSHQERRADNRRKKESRGHIYVSVVGWMDRRETGRRPGDDKMLFL